MKTLKSLNSFLFFVIILIFLIFIKNSHSNEPEDIWNIEKSENKVENISEEVNQKDDDIILKTKINEADNLNEEIINLSTKKLIGLYDPEENNLSIEMWKNSDGDQIKILMNKLNSIKLSKDAKDILQIALLTNSYLPSKNIEKNDFIDFKINFLRQVDDLELVKEFIYKNKNLDNSTNLIEFYLNENLINAKLSKSCEILTADNIKNLALSDYIEKFYIYCLISNNKIEDAKLYFDLKKELGFSDKFFETKFNFLVGYSEQNGLKLSEDSVLNFHLSHLTNKNFTYNPNNNTKKFIWKYLSKNNLLQGINEIDLENEEKVSTIEIAVHEGNYSEKDLMSLYKRFQFNIDELLNAEDNYKLLSNSKGRALLYQRLLLTKNIDMQIKFAQLIKNSMIRDNISDAFNEELSNILKEIEEDLVPSNFSSFYEKYVKNENTLKKDIKFNNKIIHQSKLINYFIEDYKIDKAEKETNELLKKIKVKKSYVFSNKDKMIIDSLKSDGVTLDKKFDNLYNDEPNIPTDLQVLINNDDIGMLLLRLTEIIGEDKIETLGTETLYFIISVLNETNLDTIRNNILLKTLPVKI